MRSLQTWEGCSEGPRDPGRSSKTTSLPLYHCLCQLNRQKRKLGPCLPWSTSACVKTLSMLFCGSGYNPETQLQLVIEKCKSVTCSGFKCNILFWVSKKLEMYTFTGSFITRVKYTHWKKNPDNIGGEKKKSKTIPFPQALYAYNLLFVFKFYASRLQLCLSKLVSIQF